MIEEAFHEYALNYLIIPDQRYLPSKCLEVAGLPPSLPTEIQHLITFGDQLCHEGVVVTDADPILKQWNPYTGAWPLHTSHHFGAQLNEDHRWLIKGFEAGTRCLYDTIHEVTHGVMASLGLMGLLTRTPPAERHRFHVAGEAMAVLLGDIEAHDVLRSSGYLDAYWPPSAQRSHAVALSPPAALEASGLNKKNRSRWLFDLYLEGRADLPSLPRDPPLRAQAFAFLIEEHSYASKVEFTVGPSWSRGYWSRPELIAFLRDFVPPHEVHLPHLDAPLTSIEDCLIHWRALTLDASPLPDALQRAHIVRLTLQRVALKVCELQGVFESYRYRGEEPQRSEASALLSSCRADLLRRFQELFTLSGTAPSMELIDWAKALLDRCVDRLSALFGSTLSLDHPHLDRIPYTEIAPPLTLPAHLIKAGESRTPAEVLATLRLVRDEARSSYRHLQDQASIDERAAQDRARAEQLYEVASHHASRLDLELYDPLRQRHAEAWLAEVQRERTLTLPLVFEWTKTHPFIDPLVGFRYQ
jgi:hypothetical protein